MVQRLCEQERSILVQQLAGWALSGDCTAISRCFVFPDFVEAFGFMTRVALAAERMNHHPEWANVYNRVDVRLTTHDADGLSMRDIELARELDRAVSAASA